MVKWRLFSNGGAGFPIPRFCDGIKRGPSAWARASHFHQPFDSQMFALAGKSTVRLFVMAETHAIRVMIFRS
jgi:hypothetical protein